MGGLVLSHFGGTIGNMHLYTTPKNGVHVYHIFLLNAMPVESKRGSCKCTRWTLINFVL